MTTTCVQCHKEFSYEWPRTAAYFCSKKCSQVNFRERNREKLNERSRQWAKDHPERRREVQFKWNNSEHGKQLKSEWHEKNWDKLLEVANRRYRESEEFRKHQRSREYAREKLRKSDRTRRCEGCGTTKELHCHHIDSNPLNNYILNLMWLCHWCHFRIHAEMRIVK